MTNPYASLVRALGRTRSFAWVGSRVLHRLDAPFRGRRHSVTSLGTGFPLCYLTVRGRNTGRERTVPLLYVADGRSIVLFASNWGRSRHPNWSANLDASGAAPVTVTVDGVERRMRSRRAGPDEAERYWPCALALWPGYAGYRARAGREIHVYVLEPTDA